jgi:hypothetical protein
MGDLNTRNGSQGLGKLIGTDGEPVINSSGKS